MILHHIIQTLFLLAGTVALSAAIFDWKWFFGSENAAPIVKFFGHKGSRLFYGAIGIVLIAAAICFYYRTTQG